MSEEISNTFNDMAAVLSELHTLRDHVKTRFSEVEKSQKKIDKHVTEVEQWTSAKLEELTNKAKDIIAGETHFRVTFEELWKTTLETLKKKYTDDTSSLIRSITDKSSEVVTIWGELEAIKRGREEFEKWSADFKERSEAALSQLKTFDQELSAVRDQAKELGESLTGIGDRLENMENMLNDIKEAQSRLMPLAHRHEGLMNTRVIPLEN